MHWNADRCIVCRSQWFWEVWAKAWTAGGETWVHLRDPWGGTRVMEVDPQSLLFLLKSKGKLVEYCMELDGTWIFLWLQDFPYWFIATFGSCSSSFPTHSHKSGSSNAAPARSLWVGCKPKWRTGVWAVVCRRVAHFSKLLPLKAGKRDWLERKSTGNHGFYDWIWEFPVNVPLNQSKEG